MRLNNVVPLTAKHTKDCPYCYAARASRRLSVVLDCIGTAMVIIVGLALIVLAYQLIFAPVVEVGR